ncbi:hypothetical protein BP6252_12159 [Coleophoma cylindrospora]|uniref:Ima1 N-terminal domain-containing protein n=1 Tax=Coleophoma cylindrospora TaxID=1849047 RepID=A0A3D8QFZ2_9HELO|nr:hypothetical protein BP6252_12159 [Coleophoma cylindrospora]
MAIFSGKKLICHYCNTKSRYNNDGRIRKWQCPTCDEKNYLDENGEITDPPIAEVSEAAGRSPSATPEPFKGWSFSSPKTSEDPFCATCLENQRRMQCFVSEYPAVLDENDPEYWQSAQDFEKQKANLEKLYPQVCSQCIGIVNARILKTKYTAQADRVSRLRMETEARRNRDRMPWTWKLMSFVESFFHLTTYIRAWNWISSRTLSDLALFTGTYLRYYGLLAGQIFHFAAMLVGLHHVVLWLSTMPYWIEVHDSLPNLSILSSLSSLISNTYGLLVFFAVSQSFAIIGLVMHLLSCWWNPYCKEMARGFTKHLSGIASWYQWTLGSLAARGMMWYFMGVQAWDGPASIATAILHAGALILLTITRQNRIVENMNTLFVPDPQRMPKLEKPTKTLSPNNSNMADALNLISQGFSQGPAVSPTASTSGSNVSYLAKRTRSPAEFPSATTSFYGSPPPQLTPTKPQRSLRSQNPGIFSEAFSQRRRFDSDDLGDQMDWSPDISEHRAFQPIQTEDLRQTGSFNQAPPAPETSAFWYKVPPAPMSQSQRLLKQKQPPNFRATSRETKENFFINMTRKSGQSPSTRPANRLEADEDGATSFNMAPPKFFPPTEGDERDSLADCFGSFSVSDNPPENPRTKEWRVHRFFQFLSLCISLLVWNITPYAPAHISGFTALGSMLICFCVGFAVVPEHYGAKFQHRPKKSFAYHTTLALLGALELSISLSCIGSCFAHLLPMLFLGWDSNLKLPLDAAGFNACYLLGNGLVLCMIVQEFIAWNF